MMLSIILITIQKEDGLPIWTAKKFILIQMILIILTGIRVGSNRDNIFVQFGNDFISNEYLHGNYHYEQIEYILGYFYHDSFKPIRIIFNLINGEVEKITYSMIFTK